MYGQTARQAIFRVLKEAPELTSLREIDKEARTWAKIGDGRSRKLADRLLIELWMMGFAISARKASDPEPTPDGRDPEVHKKWRNDKLNAKPNRNRDATEVLPPKPVPAASEG